MRLVWLADTLRKAGLEVVELPGWETRGEDRIRPQGIVCHHTATGPNVRDEVVAHLLRLGRSDLKGPLCHLGLRRDGTVVVVAAGRANHNGAPSAMWGNDSIGIEAYNDGRGEPWPAVQMKAYTACVTALCKRMGLGPERVKGHKETDPGRKIDPLFSMDGFRAGVHTALAAVPPAPSPSPSPAVPDEPRKGGPPMKLLFDKTTWQTWAVEPGRAVEVQTKAWVSLFGGDYDGTVESSASMRYLVPKLYAEVVSL